MPTVSYEINKLKNDRYAIHVRLSDGLKRVFRRKAGLTINIKNWDTKSNLPKQIDENEKLKRKKLIDLREEIYNRYDSAILEEQEINKTWLDDCVESFM